MDLSLLNLFHLIRFVDKQPDATWSMMAPSEYGFYSNVNNLVDHPRWSQGYRETYW